MRKDRKWREEGMKQRARRRLIERDVKRKSERKNKAERQERRQRERKRMREIIFTLKKYLNYFILFSQ